MNEDNAALETQGLARPRNYYVLLDYGAKPRVIHGQAEARKLGAQPIPFRTESEADEWGADWWMIHNQPSRYRPATKETKVRAINGCTPDFYLRMF